MFQPFGERTTAIAPTPPDRVKSRGKKGLGTFMALLAGDKAPSFKIATDAGETVSSAGLKG